MDSQIRSQLILQYGAGADALQAAWTSSPPEARAWKPSSDAWSAHEIVIHCADSETFAATRIRLLAAEPRPLIVGYDQDAWADAFDYANLPADLAFATIAAVRASTFDLIQRFDDRVWHAAGTHSQSGPYTAEDWLRTYAAHLHGHANQISSNIDRWRAHHDDSGSVSSERKM